MAAISIAPRSLMWCDRGKGICISLASRGRPETIAAMRKALERSGVEFTNGKRPGVRLSHRHAAPSLVTPRHP